MYVFFSFFIFLFFFRVISTGVLSDNNVRWNIENKDTSYALIFYDIHTYYTNDILYHEYMYIRVCMYTSSFVANSWPEVPANKKSAHRKTTVNKEKELLLGICLIVRYNDRCIIIVNTCLLFYDAH